MGLDSFKIKSLEQRAKDEGHAIDTQWIKENESISDIDSIRKKMMSMPISSNKTVGKAMISEEELERIRERQENFSKEELAKRKEENDKTSQELLDMLDRAIEKCEIDSNANKK